ncbi:cobalamin-5'-phosphate synthase [Cribrihabitans marinus]|uniref:Adenosylcobinamide-GDP ribazoletransferase n=1 Tax=Cribrihabitans marinus TaxID=1227549 RepID=A0A1H7A000_9RHOB|nr:adenosylcobinamide-GDP ribazoletransferase [Cribrihabitans marinus]GGH30371.1 adenosylcobinamide-GDP ribazoletransferase [Cribrihabitans marinus]SEJ54365.1 cobalamin-5'-phosphate synthase [Cribrihabitans marinus]
MKKNDKSPVSAWDVPLALVLLTRLPLPHLPEAVFSRQARAVWAYPLAGAVVGGLAVLFGWAGLALGLSAGPAAGIVLAAGILLTGAMHEDGLADSADGLWGGNDPGRRLEIMRDSRIGTYGVLALVLSALLRWTALTALLASAGLWALPAAALWSRALMPVLMGALPNARGAGLSQSVGRPGLAPVAGGLLLGVVLGFLLGGAGFAAPALLAALAALCVAALARARIGGQTGDILGAAQQVAETAFLLTASAML